MSQTTTQKLGLTKDDGNEAFLDLRPHVNANMETIDDFAGDISDSIANFETNPATSNHSAGTYFMLENTLHRAKTAIASGESITSNNAEPITIAEVLNTLNGNVSALQDSVYPSSFSYSLWGLVMFSSNYGATLDCSVPVPYGFVPTIVSVSLTTEFKVLPLESGVSSLANVHFTGARIQGVRPTAVVIELNLSANVTDTRLYRLSGAAPTITLSK